MKHESLYIINTYFEALWRFINKQNFYLLYSHGAYIIVGNKQNCARSSCQSTLTTFEDALGSKNKHKRHHVKVRRNLRGHSDHLPDFIYKTFKMEKCQGLDQSYKSFTIRARKRNRMMSPR